MPKISIYSCNTRQLDKDSGVPGYDVTKWHLHAGFLVLKPPKIDWEMGYDLFELSHALGNSRTIFHPFAAEFEELNLLADFKPSRNTIGTRITFAAEELSGLNRLKLVETTISF